MIFSNLSALWLLLPLLLALWINRYKPEYLRAALPFPKGYILDKIRETGSTPLLKFLSLGLIFIALFLCTVALARPRKVLYSVSNPNQGVDILLAIDTSESMRGLDFQPLNRLEAAKATAREFIRHRLHDRIGIVVFGAHALLQCPLTLDYESLLEFLDNVEIGMTQSDGTAIGDAMATAVNHLKMSSAKSKVIILLTDGRNNSGYISDPTLAAKTAQSFGMKIYTIGTAAKGPAPYPDPVLGVRMMAEDLDENSLTEIAEITGGKFFRATNTQELKEIYAQIDRMEKSPEKNPGTPHYQDLALYLMLPALFLLLTESLLSNTYLLRIP